MRYLCELGSINASFFCIFDVFMRSKNHFFAIYPQFWRPFWRPHFNIVFPFMIKALRDIFSKSFFVYSIKIQNKSIKRHFLKKSPQANQSSNLCETNLIIAPGPWLREPHPASGWARGSLGTWRGDSHDIPFQGRGAWAAAPHSIWLLVPLGFQSPQNLFVFPQRRVLPGSQKRGMLLLS